MKKKEISIEKLVGKLSIIYDMTKECPWECAICCMGAKNDKNTHIDELPFERKLSLMDDFAAVAEKRPVRVDFSGGEIFTNIENIRVIEKAAILLGRENVGISSSGYRIDDALARRLSACISECEMTMDAVPGVEYHLRPLGYAKAAAAAIPHLKRYGIEIGIQTVLTRSNSTESNLTALYRYLCDAGVDQWSLLKFYPSGRGRDFQDEVLTEDETRGVVSFIQSLDKGNLSEKKPAIDFHYTMPGHSKYSEECRCVRKSIGILPDGSVTACFWAVDEATRITDQKFNLGSVRENTLEEVLSGSKTAYWMNCLHVCELAA